MTKIDSLSTPLEILQISEVSAQLTSEGAEIDQITVYDLKQTDQIGESCLLLI